CLSLPAWLWRRWAFWHCSAGASDCVSNPLTCPSPIAIRRYGWDYIGLEGGSHHIWVDHCDFEQVYDGMVDVTHGSDYVTVSWNVFRLQKKCSLVGHSDSASAQAEDTGHLNVTFHHNYYVDVDERMPRMRFGNAHVFNLYCENLVGNGIQSTANAATLVENVYFHPP